MNLIYMGAGFVGACSAAVSADSGHRVLAFDINEKKVKDLSSNDPDIINSCLHEEGLPEMIINHKEKLVFTSDIKNLEEFLDSADAIYMCLPTPEKDNGESDLTAFKKATEMLSGLLLKRNNGQQSKRILIINKSTVPIDTIDLSKRILEPKGVKNFGIASNPEFLVEGQAIYDSIHPKRVVVGAESEEDFITLRKIYQRFYDSSNVNYIEMNPYEAATVKLLSNTALFTKLEYTFSVVGRICEIFDNLSYENIKKGVTSDPRIGKWGFYNSLYAGGSCLIKDAMSLKFQMEQKNAETGFIKQILASNKYQLIHFIERAENEAKFSFSGKKIAILGLSFKQGTNDIRHSGALIIIKQLLGSGVETIKAFDPAANEVCKKYFDIEQNEMYKKIQYEDNIENALKETDAVFICTDWPEFRTAADSIIQNCSPDYLIMDGRRIISHNYDELINKGFSIIAVGSPLLGKKDIGK